MKKIAILGSTGSIGTQTLEVARNNGDLEIVSLAAGSNVKKLEEQIREFHPRLVAVWTEEKAKELRDAVKDLDVKVVSGMDGLIEVCTLPEAEILSHEIDEDSMEVFDEKTSIFNPFTVEDFTSFQSDQKAAMEEKALSRGLLAEARAKAVSSVEQLFAAALPDTYTVTVQ